MNAPSTAQHLMPAVNATRGAASACWTLCRQQFGARCSTALVVREQHGRDESAYTTVPPPAAVVFAESPPPMWRKPWPWRQRTMCLSSPLAWAPR